ncbi:MAG: DUF1508 domain-containing protein [Candidatus Moranbacteria bacterium]|nr:DUF1508 domain-containing protein [Candidatus Moranbacteria bacterium]
MINPRFVIYKDKAGFYRWYLQAKNGEKVAASEAYVSKQSAIHSAYRVKEIAWEADVVDNTN